MLIRFSVENFLSFKDRASLSMIPSKGRLKGTHVISKSNRNDIPVLKTAMVFGANASGKTNIVKAIDFGKRLVMRGTQSGQPISFQNFRLNNKSRGEATRLEYEIKHKGKNYAYGFIFDKKEIKEEWLYEINLKGETKVFERSNTSVFDLENLYKKNPVEKEKLFLEFIATSTQNNQLFLTEIRNRKVKENVKEVDDLLNVIDWFQNSLTVFYPHSKSDGLEFELSENDDLNKIFGQFLDYFDTGISGLCLEPMDFDKIDIPEMLKSSISGDLLNEKSEKTKVFISNTATKITYAIYVESGEIKAEKLMTKHLVEGGIEVKFDLGDESDGTRRMIDLIPLLIDLHKDGNVFVVDEMERSLHPNLIYDLIDLFLTTSEGIKSQLIVASHESSLITQKLLRKDEIWFVTKNSKSESTLHSLEEYSVRFDKELRKDYLLGRFKAVPRFGTRSNLTVLN